MRPIKSRRAPADTNKVNDATTLVPPLRLGRLLAEVRAEVGLDVDDIAARAGDRFTVAELELAEAGGLTLDDDTIEALIAAYGVDLGELVPERSRLVIDLDEGHISVADGSAAIEEPTSPDHVLARYLGLVYALRDIPVGAPISLRDVDLSVLGAALELHENEVERRLRGIITTSQPEVHHLASSFRRRLLVPMAGVVLGATAVGTLLLVRNEGSDAEPGTTTAVVEIGGTVVVERPGTTTVPSATVTIAPDGAVEVELAPAQTVERDPATLPAATAPVTPGTIIVQTSQGPVELIEAVTLDR